MTKPSCMCHIQCGLAMRRSRENRLQIARFSLFLRVPTPESPESPPDSLDAPNATKKGSQLMLRAFHYLIQRISILESSEFNYSIISITTPDPTVLPPSLIANLSPSSIAIGVISSISITTLSPGMHISVPSGR